MRPCRPWLDTRPMLRLPHPRSILDVFAGDRFRPGHQIMFPKQNPPQRSKAAIAVAVIAVIVALAAIAAALCAFKRPWGVEPDAGKYQAVFLTNGQVYFGKLSGIGSPSPVLDDVYYLQVNQGQQLQQGAEGGNVTASGTPAGTPDQPKFSLMKLGQSEVHGPEDRIFLMKDQMLFWENLRSDSQVVKTIESSQNQGTK